MVREPGSRACGGRAVAGLPAGTATKCPPNDCWAAATADGARRSSKVNAACRASHSVACFAQKDAKSKAAALGITPEEIFDSWVREDRVDRFFGSGARRLEPREGGLYEITFGVRPDGEIGGPRGNRILKYEPPRALDSSV